MLEFAHRLRNYREGFIRIKREKSSYLGVGRGKLNLFKYTIISPTNQGLMQNKNHSFWWFLFARKISLWR
jgi:hypothetical protein